MVIDGIKVTKETQMIIEYHLNFNSVSYRCSYAMASIKRRGVSGHISSPWERIIANIYLNCDSYFTLEHLSGLLQISEKEASKIKERIITKLHEIKINGVSFYKIKESSIERAIDELEELEEKKVATENKIKTINEKLRSTLINPGQLQVKTEFSLARKGKIKIKWKNKEISPDELSFTPFTKKHNILKIIRKKSKYKNSKPVHQEPLLQMGTDPNLQRMMKAFKELERLLQEQRTYLT